jgi:hypothetical protein
MNEFYDYLSVAPSEAPQQARTSPLPRLSLHKPFNNISRKMHYRRDILYILK